ncbi:MAG: hypothetical protein JJ913_08525 [Rhizobiaceae bacterium]|nr:hypothetical protein [Rhizobiaceae bacterium]
MSARFTTLLGLDARLQHRYGIYYAYAFVVAFYAVLLTMLGEWLPAWAVGIVVYSDPAVLGFFFLGALMMLEKAEGARAALAITPVSPADYFWSKALTLTLVAIVAVTVIGATVHAEVNWALLLAATVLTSIQFIGIGVPVARLFKTVSSYLIGSTGLLVPVVLPCLLALYDPMPGWAVAIPAASQLKLILVSFGAGSAGTVQISMMLGVSAVAAAAGAWWGIRSLEGELGGK